MRLAAVLLLYGCLWQFSWAGEFSALVNDIRVEKSSDQYILDADISYKLSPVVKEALKKGISMSWTVQISVQREGLIWNHQLSQTELGFRIQNHALLNLYSVKSLHAVDKHVFSTLGGAIDYISRIRGVAIIDKALIQADQRYQIAVKVSFEHESLPIPIRPFSYFDKQWALSSSWTLWPLQN